MISSTEFSIFSGFGDMRTMMKAPVDASTKVKSEIYLRFEF